MPQPPLQMGTLKGSLGELLSAEQAALLPLPFCFPGTVVRGQGLPLPRKGHQGRLYPILLRGPSPLLSTPSTSAVVTLALGALPAWLCRLGLSL